MAHIRYEEAKKVAFKGFVLLGIVTIIEVFIALLGKGYIVDGFHLPRSIMYLAMIIMSLYKAYFIVFEFMHMRYEVPGLVKSVLLPTLLLVWAIIAFFSEGNTWNHWRAKIQDRPLLTLEQRQHKHSVHPSSSEGHAAMPIDSNTIQSKDTVQTKTDTLHSMKGNTHH